MLSDVCSWMLYNFVPRSHKYDHNVTTPLSTTTTAPHHTTPQHCQFNDEIKNTLKHVKTRIPVCISDMSFYENDTNTHTHPFYIKILCYKCVACGNIRAVGIRMFCKHYSTQISIRIFKMRVDEWKWRNDQLHSFSLLFLSHSLHTSSNILILSQF